MRERTLYSSGKDRKQLFWFSIPFLLSVLEWYHWGRFGLAVAAVFGWIWLGLLVYCLPGTSSLKLKADRFRMVNCFLFGSSYLWRDVEGFVLCRTRLRMAVGFRLVPDRLRRNPFRRWMTRRKGFSGLLLTNYGMEAEELLRLMREWKARSAAEGFDAFPRR